jgi:hypothetical protein
MSVVVRSAWRCPECGSGAGRRGEKIPATSGSIAAAALRRQIIRTRYVWCDQGHAWVGRSGEPDTALKRIGYRDRLPLSDPDPN